MYLKKVFEALRNIPVRMVSYGGSKHNISFLITSKYKKKRCSAINSVYLGYNIQYCLCFFHPTCRMLQFGKLKRKAVEVIVNDVTIYCLCAKHTMR